MKSILITGSSGVIGKRLTKDLISKGFKVDTLGRGINSTYCCDLSSHESIELKQKYDLLLHLAVDQKSIEKNIEMTKNIIKMRESFVSIIYFSSVSVYKNQAYTKTQYYPSDDIYALTDYERGKILCENLFRQYAVIYRLAPFFDKSYTDEISKRVRIPFSSLLFITSWPRHFSFSSLSCITKMIETSEIHPVGVIANLCDDKLYCQEDILNYVNSSRTKKTIRIPYSFKRIMILMLSLGPHGFMPLALRNINKLFFSKEYVV